MVPRILALIVMTACFSLAACSSGDGGSQKVDKTKQQQSSGENQSGGLAAVKDDESQSNILQIAASSDAHKTLAKAVKAADLGNTLSNPGPFTAFAPTDEAFNQVPKANLESLMKPENKKKLADILQRHVAPVSYDKERLKKMADKGQKLFMANGDYLSLQTKNGKLMIEDAKIVQSIKASNGMVYVVDKVILP